MARTRYGGGDGQGSGRDQGVDQTPGEPEGSDRFQQMQDQITALTAVVQQLVQQQAAVQATPAPPLVQTPEPVPEEPVIPPAASVPPVVTAPATATTSGAAAPTVNNPSVAAAGTFSRPITPAATEGAVQAEKARAKAVLMEFKKFQPPTFDGATNDDWAVEKWVLRMEKLFRDAYTEDHDRVHLAAHYFEGEADQWWSEILRDQYGGIEPQWHVLKDALYDRYLNDVIKQGLERQLETMRQEDRTVRDYEREFSRVCALVPHAVRDMQRKVRLFSQGLRPEIRRLLSPLDIRVYRVCVNSALAVEADMTASRAERQASEKGKGKKRPFSGSGDGSSGTNWRPPRPPRGQNQVANSRGSNQQQRSRPCIFCGADHRPYTCSQRHGKCYQCGQPGHLSANCPQRSATAPPVLSVQPLASRPAASTQSVAASSRQPPSRQTEGSRQISGGRVYALTQQGEPSGEGPSGA